MKTISTLFNDQKAQTGMEYLLIIAGAVLVVAVVSISLKNAASGAGQQAADQSAKPIN